MSAEPSVAKSGSCCPPPPCPPPCDPCCPPPPCGEPETPCESARVAAYLLVLCAVILMALAILLDVLSSAPSGYIGFDGAPRKWVGIMWLALSHLAVLFGLAGAIHIGTRRTKAAKAFVFIAGFMALLAFLFVVIWRIDGFRSIGTSMALMFTAAIMLLIAGLLLTLFCNTQCCPLPSPCASPCASRSGSCSASAACTPTPEEVWSGDGGSGCGEEDIAEYDGMPCGSDPEVAFF